MAYSLKDIVDLSTVNVVAEVAKSSPEAFVAEAIDQAISALGADHRDALLAAGPAILAEVRAVI